MAKIHANSHTVSGNLAADADIHPLQFPVDGSSVTRFRFRIGCDKFTRNKQGKPETRTTWFTIRFDVKERAVKYYTRFLKKGAEVLVVGEQLVDEVIDDTGHRFFHYISGQTLTVLTEAKAKDEEIEAPQTTQSTQRPKLVAVPKPVAPSTPPRPQPKVLSEAPILPEDDASSSASQHTVTSEDLQQAVTW